MTTDIFWHPEHTMPCDRIGLKPCARRLFTLPLSPDGRLIGGLPPGWESIERSKESNDMGPGIARITLKTTNGALTVSGFPPFVDHISVNLPRVGGDGGHGSVCKDQPDVARCFDAANELLDEVSKCDEEEPTYLVTSLELGCNFVGDKSDIVNRARASKHPWVRAEPTRGHFGEVKFSGREFQLCIYAKAALLKKCGEVASDIPDVFRIEATLSGRKLAKVTGMKNVPFKTLSFEAMCGWLRQCIAPLAYPKAVDYAPKGNLNTLAYICAKLDASGQTIHDIRFTDFASKHMSRRTRSRFLKAIHTKVAAIDDEWSWARLFPADGWPKAVELTQHGLLVDGKPYGPHGHAAQVPAKSP